MNKLVETQKMIDESGKMLSNGEIYFSSIFHRVMKSHQDNIAFIHHEDNGTIREYSYEQYNRMSHGCANKLSVLFKGTSKDSVIAIKLKNTPAWCFIFWGILMSGHRPLLIDSKLSKENVENLLKDSKAIGIVSDDNKTYSVKTITKDNINDISEDINFEPNWSDEVIFCSSGTTGNIKLMIFNGLNMVHQLNASKNIPQTGSDIIYPTEIEDLRIIALIPFHHIFAFTTMFLWYTFYGCTIVLTDFNDPTSLINDIREFKVTHIFHVPLFYQVVMKNFFSRLDDETRSKVNKLIDYNLGKINLREAGLTIGLVEKKVKENIFGTNVKFLISGGGYLSNEISNTFNGIGYSLHNGYGMTEVGVTSVDLSTEISDIIKCSIGKPFNGVSYRISKKGELLIKSPITHIKEIVNGVEVDTTFEDGYFPTGDIFIRDANDNYYMKGRMKDVIITSNGENIYPDEVESYFKNVKNVNNLAAFDGGNKTVLVVETNDDSIIDELNKINTSLPLNKQVNDIVVTHNALPLSSSMKVKRYEVQNNYKKGLYKSNAKAKVIDILARYDKETKTNVINRLTKVFQTVLFKKEPIDGNAHWINDLHSDSMTYVTLVSEIDKEFKIKIPIEKYGKLTTLNEFAKEILDSSCK